MKQRKMRWIAGLMTAAMLTGLLPAGAAATPASGHVIDVTDYGADPTGVRESTTAVEKALEAAKKLPADEEKTLYFPEGKYHFYADYAPVRELYVSNTVGLNQAYKDKHIGILVEDMENLTIDGGGSMFMYHGDITTFAAIDSENITFTNFSFDHASPSVVDLTVESKVEGENAVIVYVPSCYDYEIVNGNSIQWYGEKGPVTGEPYWQGMNGLNYCQIYDTVSGRCWRGSGIFNGVSGIEDVGNDRLKFTYSGGLPTVGYSYEIRHAIRTTPGAFIWQSSNVTLKDLNAHFLHGFGIVGQLSKDITLDGVSFRTRPESGRTTAGFADFVQMSSVGGKVTMKNCDFSVAHDDPINIHGTFLTVEEVSEDGKTLTVRYRHNETAGFPQYYVGDQVDFSTKGTMVPVADSLRTVTEVLDNGWGKDTMKIVLDRPVEGLTGGAQYVIENVTYTPEVEITGCRFANIPTRGILVTTRKPVLIENNYFDAMEMASIFISCDAQGWYESGHTENVTIRGNVFDRPGSECILVGPTGSNDPNHQLHSNMTIEDNIFNLDRSVQVVNAKSVRNLTIRNNTVNRYNPNVDLSVASSSDTLKAGETLALDVSASGTELGSQLYRFENCKNVVIEENTYDAGLNQKVEVTAGTTADDVTITGDDLRIGQDNRTPPGGEIRYLSSDPGVLTVDADGNVTAVAPGTAQVTVYTLCGDRLYAAEPLSFTVTEGAAAEGVSVALSAEKSLMDVGETQQLTASASDESAISWSVRGDAVTVSEEGVVTAVKSGVAEVTAAADSGAYNTVLVAVRKAAGDKSDAWTVDRDAGNWEINGENGALTIHAKAGGDWATGNRASSIFLTQPASGDFTATVKLHNKTTATYEEAGLIAFVDNENYVTIQRKHANGNPCVAVVTEEKGSPNEDGAIPDAFGDVLWFRLEKKGDTVTGSYSENGTDWTEVRSVTNAGLSGCKVGVLACNSVSDTPFTFSEVTVDGVEVPFAAQPMEPAISDAAVTFADNTAAVEYTFAVDDQTQEGESVCRWYISDTADGTFQPVAGGEGKTLGLTGAMSGRYLKAAVVPVDEKGRVGEAVYTAPAEVPAVERDPSDASLVALELGGVLQPAFDPAVSQYELVLPQSVDTLPVIAGTSNPEAGVAVTLDGQPVDGKASLTKDAHTLAVVVTAADGVSTKTYTVHIARRADSTAALSDLELGTLDFDPDTRFYQLLIQSEEDLSLSLSPVGDGTVKVMYNHEILADGETGIQDLPLPNGGGLNTLEVTVTAADGVSTALYRVSILKTPSDNADLSSITLDGQPLAGFDSAETFYKVPVTANSVTIAAAAADENAKVQILADGAPAEGGVAAITKDLTEVTIAVTAENGSTTKTYTIYLVRSRADNADLLGLTVSGVALDFDPAQSRYDLTTSAAQVTVEARAVEDGATIHMESDAQQQMGTSAAKGVFALTAGENRITVTVTAPDGVTKKVTELSITMEPSVYLSDLDWTSATTGDGSYNGGMPVKDGGWEGYQLALADENGAEKVFEKGIGTHANSTIVYDLSGSEFATFTACVGVSYKKYGHSDDPQLKFTVSGDGETLYTSPVMFSKTPYETISVDISGVKTLTLTMETTKGNVWSAHGNWADAKLIMAEQPQPERYPVTAAGGVWTNFKTAPADELVTVHPEKGAALSGVTVKAADGTEIAVTAQEDGTYTFQMPAQGVTVTGVPAEKQYTVTFEYNNGNAPYTVTITENKTVTPPETPANGDFDFDGWYIDASCTTPYDFTAPVTGDLTLYAGWKMVGPSVDHDDDKEEPEDPTDPDIEDPDTPLDPTPGFTDVADDFWGKEAIDYVVAEGLMNGTSETTFAPNVTTTRAMLMTILARMDGVDTTGSDPWYAKGMEWAVTEGVSDGTNPEGTITREQLAVMLYRYAGSPAVSADSLTFADADAVSDWAVDGVRWAVANGILSGKGSDTLDPQGNATRAEIAQMLYNFSKIG